MTLSPTVFDQHVAAFDIPSSVMNSRRFMGFPQVRTDPYEREATRTGAEKLEMENGSVKAA